MVMVENFPQNIFAWNAWVFEKRVKLVLVSHDQKVKTHKWGVVAERIRAPNSSSDASVQQSVGSNPGRDTCVPEQDT